MKSPFFSIFLPAKGRLEYLAEAIESVLLQDFQDIELVVSNNGADAALRDVAEKYRSNAKVRYVEQPEVLNMPTHWEKVTQELVGEYILILTDRSVLKAGALHYLHRQITKEDERPNVISWPWDLYYDHLKILLPYPATEKKMHSLSSDSQLMNTANGIYQFPYALPRGLNSCVRNDFINHMRVKHGAIFRPLTPDFSFGYLCLLNTSKFFYIERPLFVSQGLMVSNGGNSFGGDASPYFNSLNLKNPFQHVPLKLPLVQNGIHEDFLAMASLCGRDDLLKVWNRKNYYLECFAEIDAKRETGILRNDWIDEIERALVQTLMKESKEIQQGVKHTRTTIKKIRTRIIGLIKKTLGARLETIRRYVLLGKRGGITCQTALEAAGFDALKIK